jgi:hypothetical protein
VVGLATNSLNINLNENDLQLDLRVGLLQKEVFRPKSGNISVCIETYKIKGHVSR